MFTSLIALVAAALGVAPDYSDPFAPGTVVTVPVDSIGDPATNGDPISDDSPLFDCRTMGDLHCGPDATVPVRIAPGVYVLVPLLYAPAPGA